ncbi:Uncharacterised protein [Aerococcus viridans]|uniref:Uncharacterized protein n=2 Tax=Aerococcus viridans TaxID=1377 RepID=A0AAU8U4G5_9LACT|nr:hypothetical protein [Aerococcus viridans]AMC01204.1 hypothetical protein AWM76_06420 [Aerococcus viridans]EFG50441.1 hypothetical protein HMPREF0061_0217 [Aerococcus viridans ATCC 11563 = CCUG 4311]SUU16888.1 Uncharacterised protein [Aerococcus viridans]
MKDYIYLDTELLNSNLAQAYEGLPIKSSNEEQLSNNNSTTSNHDVHGDVSVMPAGVGTSFGGKISNSESEGLTESQKDVLESAFHDYAVDLLIEKFSSNDDLVSNKSELKVGDMFQLSGNFKIIDFEYLAQVSDITEIEGIINPEQTEFYQIQAQINLLYKQKGKNNITRIKQLEKQRDGLLEKFSESTTPFKIINDLSEFSKKLYPETIIFKMDNLIILLDKKYLRNNVSQINALSFSNRKAVILGLTISKVDSVWSQDKKIEDIQPNNIGSIPSIISDIILSSFDLISVNDYYVKPIAVYFE